MRIILCLLSAVLVASVTFAGSETIIPESIVSAENSWKTNSLGGKVAAVTDGNDAFYVYDDVGGNVQRFTLTDESTIPTDATIDSFVVLLRAQKTTAGTTRIRNRIRMDGNANFCDGSNITLTTSWVNYAEKFTLTPTSSGACAGSLTKSRIDSLNIQLLSVGVPVGGAARVTDVDFIIYFTESGAAPALQSRRRIVLSFQEENEYEQIIGHGDSGITFDFVFAVSQPWLWYSK